MSSTMLREIHEQPSAIEQTLSALLPLVPELASLASDCRQVLFLARGSSDNAAVYGRTLVELHSGQLATLGSPSVATVYQRSLDLSGVLAVAISQSGATEEIVQSAEWARSCGARIVGVTNEADSPLAATADVALVTQAGRELAVPATKTYTTQLAALAVLAHALAPSAEFERELQAVPSAVEAALAIDVSGVVELLTAAGNLVVTGRGYCQSTALELALKVKETCYLNSSGLSVADLLHGPIAVLDEHTPCVVVAPSSGPVLPGLRSLVERVRTVGAPCVVLGGDDDLGRTASVHRSVPSAPEALAPLSLIVPGQVIVEALARARGIDPDAPRSLTKVTQT